MPSNSKLKPSCGNCTYSYFKHDDPEETERCKLVGRFNESAINLEAKMLIEKREEAGFEDMGVLRAL